MIKKTRSVAVLLNVRKTSSRCQNKLLRNFGGTTLFAIALSKLEQIIADEKYLCAYDDEFFNVSVHNSIRKIRRSYESANVDGPMSKVFEAAGQVESDYFMFFNPCCAHISVKTLQSAINHFCDPSNISRSMTSVIKTRDWIFNEKEEMIIGPTSNGDTKSSPISYRVAHVFHIFDKKRLLEKNAMWSGFLNDPQIFEIDHLESVDVDEEFEFLISESIYNN